MVFTPKGLLRLRAASSTLDELTDGQFQFVLDDGRVSDREKIDRLVLCSGKVFYDIDGHERRQSADTVAIGRVELLYPFARHEIRRLIESYPNLRKIVWAQEEPKNMGAWSVMARRLPELTPETSSLRILPTVPPGFWALQEIRSSPKLT